jgi:hypothetical protein
MMLMACDVLAPLFSLVLAAEVELVVLLDAVLGAGAETTAATTLGCDEGAVLDAVLGAGGATGSVIVVVAVVVVAATGSVTVIAGGNNLFNASMYPGQVGLYSGSVLQGSTLYFKLKLMLVISGP